MLTDVVHGLQGPHNRMDILHLTHTYIVSFFPGGNKYIGFYVLICGWERQPVVMSSCQHFLTKYKHILIAFCFVYLHQFDFVVFIYSTGIHLSKHQQNGNFPSFQPLKIEHVGVPHAPRSQCCQSSAKFLVTNLSFTGCQQSCGSGCLLLSH